MLAWVGSEPITVPDFEQSLAAARRSGDAVRRLELMTVGGKKSVLEDLIDMKALARAAEKEGLATDPEVRLALQRAREQILADEFRHRLISTIDQSDVALREYYEAHADEFRSPPRIHLRHIVTLDASLAETLRRRAKMGEDFAAIARDHNVDGTASRGGDLGWVEPGVLTEELERIAFSMTVNEISPVIQSGDAFHIFQARQIERGQLPPLEAIRARVEEARQTRLLESTASRLRSQDGIRYAEHTDSWLAEHP